MAFSSGSGKGRRQTFSEINITPLTDVFLVLLIIMILIAPLINQGALKVEPPIAQHGKAQKDQDKSILVEVNKEGVIAVNNIPISDQNTPIEDIESLVADAIKGQFKKLGDEVDLWD
jgi:biopolymer transport protein ExbD/biopolymer transport protein TolR